MALRLQKTEPEGAAEHMRHENQSNIAARRWMRLIYVACVAAAFITAVIFVRRTWQISAERKAGVETYDEMSRYVQTASPGPRTASARPAASSGADASLPPKERVEFPTVDFEALREKNEQVVGWITCENTVVNYPIVQGADNDYYVDHMIDGAVNASGCIFLDCRNERDFSDSHSVIYGHHMQNGTMFALLEEFRSQEFYESHPRFLLVTPEKNFVVRIFAGYVAAIDEDAWDVDFNSRESFERWIGECMGKSCLTTDIIPTADDRVLTMSTCSNEFQDARFVLLGILDEY